MSFLYDRNDDKSLTIVELLLFANDNPYSYCCNMVMKFLLIDESIKTFIVSSKYFYLQEESLHFRSMTDCLVERAFFIPEFR